MRSSFIALVACLIALVAYLDHRGYTYVPNPDPNHTHADFAIWIDGEKLDFAQRKYMSGVSWDEGSHDTEDEYHHEHLHLHDDVGHVLHRHKPGLTIAEFLESLGFAFANGCMRTDEGKRYCDEWRMFVNTEEQEPSAEYVFVDMDQILFTYGATDADVQAQLEQMTEDACLYSRTCPWKGDPPDENCVADPTVPCVLPPESL